MKRSHLRLFTLALLAFALVASSCWRIVVVRVRPNFSVGAGGTTYLQVDLAPLSKNLNGQNMYVFLLVGYEHAGMESSSAVWDSPGDWGGGGASWKVTHSGNATFVGELVTNGGCEVAIGSGSVRPQDAAGDFTWRVWITPVKIDNSDDNKVDTLLRFRQVIRGPNPLPSQDYGTMVFFAGVTGDKVSGICTSMGTATVAFG